MADEIVAMYCPYCHKHTSLTQAVSQWRKPCIWLKSPSLKWWIGICNYCREPVLILNKGQIIFPHPLPSPSDDRIPENIKKDLDEAKLCFSVNAYRSCAVMARRALQSTCIEKGVTSNRLIDQIQELAINGIITKDLKEWADEIRWTGNDAAHPKSDEVNKEDAEDILKMSEQFLEIVYVTPSIAKERREKREK